MTPTRIQRQRRTRMPANTIYVGRGSQWANPFRVVQVGSRWEIKTDGSPLCNKIYTRRCQSWYNSKAEATKDAVMAYDYWLVPSKAAHSGFYNAMLNIDEMFETLKGKNLACWCAPDQRCHADVLLKIVNQ